MFKQIFPTTTLAVSTGTWRWIYVILALAFAARLLLAYTTASPLHADEKFQYYEQAHRLVYGYGLIPWEYTYGIRSWLIPLIISGILVFGQAIGFDHPDSYIPLVETVFCLISLALPVAVYRFSQFFLTETEARTAFVMSCFWHTFVYAAHKPMPGMLATYSLMWMCVLMCRAPEPRRLVLLGVLSALTLVLRYQLLPVVGLLNLFALIVLGRSYAYILAGNIAVLIFAGWLDFVFWGAFLSSFIDNFVLNFKHDIASTFGVSGPHYYVGWLTVRTGGLALPAFIGMFLLPRTMWPFLGALMVGFLAFHIPAHKELRFVMWVYPIFLICLAVFSCRVVSLVNLPDKLAPLARNATVLAAAVVSLFFMSKQTGPLTKPYFQEYNDIAEIYSVIASDPTVTGIEHRTPSVRWWRSGAYYAIHQPVPVYFTGWQLPDEGSADPARAPYISHVITETPESPPDFVLQKRAGQYHLWQNTAPRVTGGWETYDCHTPLSAREILSQITPRGARGQFGQCRLQAF